MKIRNNKSWTVIGAAVALLLTASAPANAQDLDADKSIQTKTGQTLASNSRVNPDDLKLGGLDLAPKSVTGIDSGSDVQRVALKRTNEKAERGAEDDAQTTAETSTGEEQVKETKPAEPSADEQAAMNSGVVGMFDDEAFASEESVDNSTSSALDSMDRDESAQSDGAPLETASSGRHGGDIDETSQGIGRVDNKQARSSAPPVKANLGTYAELDKVKSSVNGYQNEVLGCYADRLAEAPQLEGKLAVKFTVAPDGDVFKPVVTDESTIDDAQLESCVTDKMQDWALPVPVTGQNTIYTHSFLLMTN